ncbi:S9 family peptidase [Geothrix sp. PMB-07]|uniref:S9 family peptidase n=1 Tax=Geothrix sp. PMB-07 TaxID=3068640 RepID=UPI002741E1B3|nr:S9 family peptidase [Geothrix sp. PMB-07]WLT30964.1 prolyl oligopeptidase family serine peptidase [Geothrix sp. PMB-07]
MSSKAIALALCLGSILSAQGTRADYQRATRMRELVTEENRRMAVDPTWAEDGASFWYRRSLSQGGQEWLRVQAQTGRKSPAFDHTKLASGLTKVLGRTIDPAKLPIEGLSFPGDVSHLLFRTEEGWWRFNLKTAALTAGTPPKSGPQPPPTDGDDEPSQRTTGLVISPNGRWSAQLQDSNVVVRSAGGKEIYRTTDGTTNDAYTGSFLWSPDGQKLVAQRSSQVPIHKVTLVESSPKDQLEPKTHVLDYAKPGDPLPVVRPVLINPATRTQTAADPALAPNPYFGYGEDLRVIWAKDSSRYFYVHNQRGHQVLRVIAVDAATGASRVIVDERSATFIDYSGKQFLEVLGDTDELVWMSERDGWNHLYLVDSRMGVVKNQITRGQWVVRSVVNVDPKRREILFLAGGIVPGQDPYYLHLAKIRFDGTGLKVLTSGDGTHSVTMNKDHSAFVDVWSRVDQPPVAELRRASDGSLITELERFDAKTLTAAGWRAPQRFVAKGRDGQTDIHGVIYRPSTYDPAKKYPVIEYIYAGPQDSFAPKAFRRQPMHWDMVELDFILVSIDGMGTSNRSKAFHDVCWKNLGDAGFPDRILWMKAAAAQDPAMDLSRVGIFGGSAGGQDSLRGLLAFGDFYKAGVSDCGCHDNRMDKVWWNEQWMGWPIGPHYAEQSNVTNASRLQGALLLLVGELDSNVDPSSTLQVVNALVKADKDFEMLVVPGSNHGTMRIPHVERRVKDFFVRHLLGASPRAN